jgi:pSer/pThr/pTyr-binding forkhead associated (FHA) protein
MVDAGKFCPACQLLNEASATECIYCGVPFEKDLGTAVSTTRQTKVDKAALSPEAQALLQNAERDIPENGLAIYLADHERPFDVRTDDDILVGRKTEDTSAKMVDLTPFHAFNMGISRRHVRIQRIGNRYQVTDLYSTNGTWLNGERLAPDMPMPLPNAAQLRLGKLRLYVVYRLKK